MRCAYFKPFILKQTLKLISWMDLASFECGLSGLKTGWPVENGLAGLKIGVAFCKGQF